MRPRAERRPQGKNLGVRPREEVRWQGMRVVDRQGGTAAAREELRCETWGGTAAAKEQLKCETKGRTAAAGLGQLLRPGARASQLEPAPPQLPLRNWGAPARPQLEAHGENLIAPRKRGPISLNSLLPLAQRPHR